MHVRDATAWTDLYWLPLGAGGHVVRFNGRVYERLVALREHRQPLDLYHSALLLHLGGTTYATEMGPARNVAAPDRGVVVEGAVGARWLRRWRAFTYEVRCWPGADHDMTALRPPAGGRAPGWQAGLVLAERLVRPVAVDV